MTLVAELQNNGTVKTLQFRFAVAMPGYYQRLSCAVKDDIFLAENYFVKVLIPLKGVLKSVLTKIPSIGLGLDELVIG